MCDARDLTHRTTVGMSAPLMRPVDAAQLLADRRTNNSEDDSDDDCDWSLQTFIASGTHNQLHDVTIYKERIVYTDSDSDDDTSAEYQTKPGGDEHIDVTLCDVTSIARICPALTKFTFKCDVLSAGPNQQPTSESGFFPQTLRTLDIEFRLPVTTDDGGVIQDEKIALVRDSVHMWMHHINLLPYLQTLNLQFVDMFPLSEDFRRCLLLGLHGNRSLTSLDIRTNMRELRTRMTSANVSTDILSSLSNLTRLSISSRVFNVNGILRDNMNRLEHMQVLDCKKSLVVDGRCVNLMYMRNLRELNVMSISGRIGSILGASTSLTKLYVHRADEDAFESFRHCTTLKELAIGRYNPSQLDLTRLLSSLRMLTSLTLTKMPIPSVSFLVPSTANRLRNLALIKTGPMDNSLLRLGMPNLLSLTLIKVDTIGRTSSSSIDCNDLAGTDWIRLESFTDQPIGSKRTFHMSINTTQRINISTPKPSRGQPPRTRKQEVTRSAVRREVMPPEPNDEMPETTDIYTNANTMDEFSLDDYDEDM